MKLTIFAATGGIGHRRAARIRPGTIRATGSWSGTWPTPSSSGRCASTTRTWPGWRTYIRRGLFVSRADVVHYMLRAAGQPATFRQTVGIAN